jgi:hypothetical protein
MRETKILDVGVTVESVYDLAQPNNLPSKAGLKKPSLEPHDRGPGSAAMTRSIGSFIGRIAPWLFVENTSAILVFQQHPKNNIVARESGAMARCISNRETTPTGFELRGAVRRRSLVARTDETRTRSSSHDIDDIHGNTSDSRRKWRPSRRNRR